MRIKAEKREDEIEELYTLQDDLEQYLRKNSLEIHGIPESAYKSTEDAVIHVAKTLYVVIGPEDIDISLKLHLTAAWLAQLESAGLPSGRSRVHTPAGLTLRVFK